MRPAQAGASHHFDRVLQVFAPLNPTGLLMPRKLITLVLVIVQLPQAGQAAERSVPKAVVQVGRRQQAGNVRAYCWTDYALIETCADQSFFRFPMPRVVANDKFAIVFDKVEPPAAVTLRFWSQIRRDRAGHDWFDKPLGRPTVTTAQPELVAGPTGVRWQVTVAAPRSRFTYVDATAEWQLDALCPGCSQWASWDFALRRD